MALLVLRTTVPAFYSLKGEVSNGNFPNPWPLDPTAIVPFPPFLEAQSTAWQLNKQLQSIVHPGVKKNLSLEITPVYEMKDTT